MLGCFFSLFVISFCRSVLQLLEARTPGIKQRHFILSQPNEFQSVETINIPLNHALFVIYIHPFIVS